MTVRVGLDVLAADQFAPLRQRRVGLFTHAGAVDSRLQSAYRGFVAELRASRVTLTALFTGEHGLSGAADAGQAIPTLIDPSTGVPVHSLYGDTLRPTPDMLADVDVIVCDVQDVGARFYTFTSTLGYVLEAAGDAGIEVIVLDRPNPLGGDRIDGAMLHPDYASFVGRFPQPIQHGMTIGELAAWINSVHNPTPASLSIIPCLDWKRAHTWEQTGLMWVPTSPNMSHFSTVQHYPGACLVEGTNLSEGRGTALPFEIVGAPFVDGEELAERLNAQAWMGCAFRPHTFSPSASKWAGQRCHGVQVHCTDPRVFLPIRVWLGVVMAIRARYPDDFTWIPAIFDRLMGNADVRAAIEHGETLRDISAAWDDDRDRWMFARQPYLLYE